MKNDKVFNFYSSAFARKTKRCLEGLSMGTFCLFIPYLSAHPSLLFTENEVNLIHQNLSPHNEGDEATAHSRDIYLSGILYVDTGHWSLWLNKRIIRSDNFDQIRDFHIEGVSPQAVKFSWILPHSTRRMDFTLRPNQIFLAKENRIITK